MAASCRFAEYVIHGVLSLGLSPEHLRCAEADFLELLWLDIVAGDMFDSVLWPDELDYLHPGILFRQRTLGVRPTHSQVAEGSLTPPPSQN